MGAWYSFGDYDIVIVIVADVPNAESMAAKKADAVAKTYRPAR